MFTLSNKIGTALSLSGCMILLGLNWLGAYIVVIGIALVVIGLILALKNNTQYNESKWVHDNTHVDED